MDEEEDEENASSRTGGSRVGNATLVIVKSNMGRLCGHRARSAYPKHADKLSLLLFALIFSNFRCWFTCAEDVNRLNDSRSRTGSTSATQFEKFRQFSGDDVPALERRIRHDTTKGVASKRLISFESVSNSVPQSEPLVAAKSARNASVFEFVRDQEASDDEYADRFVLEKAQQQRDDSEMLEMEAQTESVSTSIATPAAEKLSSPPGYNNSCSCFGGKKKVSRAFHDLTISVQHTILNTSEGITAGIVYQGKNLFRLNYPKPIDPVCEGECNKQPGCGRLERESGPPGRIFYFT